MFMTSFKVQKAMYRIYENYEYLSCFKRKIIPICVELAAIYNKILIIGMYELSN